MESELAQHRATVILRREEKFLLVREANWRWLLPGGRIGRKELPMIAAIRELNEETQLSPRAIAFLFAHGKDANLHQVFEVQLDEGAEPVASNEIVECGWFTREELNSLNTSAATRKIIERIHTPMDNFVGPDPFQVSI